MTSCAGILVVVAVGTGTTAGILAAAPNAGTLILWGAGAGILWRSVRRTRNPAGLVEDPLPYPTDLGPEDYVSADQAYVFRKRTDAVGYSVQKLDAPADADTSPGLAD